VRQGQRWLLVLGCWDGWRVDWHCCRLHYAGICVRHKISRSGHWRIGSVGTVHGFSIEIHYWPDSSVSGQAVSFQV